MSDESDDKTEDPTRHKLDDARKKGQVAKSQDLTHACGLSGALIALLATSDQAAQRLRRIVNLGHDFGDGDLPLIDVYRRIGSIAIEAGLIVLPPLLAAAVLGALGAAMQVGLAVSMEAVSPKPENIDPMQGLKRIFSVKSLLQLAQMVVKAAVLGVVLWAIVVTLLPMISGAPHQTPAGVAAIGWQAITRMLMIAALLFLIFGIIDYAIQRIQFMKQMRMTKDEVKKESKSQEGDPEIKQKRKEIARADANSVPVKTAVGGANAVIVNPTHYAVAVRYRREEGLPCVVAKGVDAAAQRIREFAEQQGVPVFSNPPLARALHKVPEGSEVPEELFEAVAAVLRWVEQVGRKRLPEGRA